jgi:predicted HicB family RNase H-like nuclease
MGKIKKPGKKDHEEQILGVTRSGTVITEGIAEQMAKEFERDGFDVSKLERRHVGRPSLGPAGHSPRVSFRVPPDLYKAAWARADKENRSLSDLAREAFNRYMNS